MRSLLTVVILALAGASTVFAPLGSPENYYFMDTRSRIACGWETRGQPNPGWAVDRKVGAAWGECQVKYWSAVHYGGFDEQMRLTGVPSRNPGELFTYAVNRKVSARIFQTCEDRLGERATDVSVFHCYGTGKLDSNPPTTRRVWGFNPNRRAYGWITVASYSKQMASDAATMRMKK